MRDSFKIHSLVGDHLHFAGVERGVDGLRRALGHRAFHRDHVFRSQHLGLGVQLRAGVGVKHDLRDAIAIAQMNKDHAAQIAAAMHPAHQQGGLAHVRRRATGRRCACGAGRPRNLTVLAQAFFHLFHEQFTTNLHLHLALHILH